MKKKIVLLVLLSSLLLGIPPFAEGGENSWVQEPKEYRGVPFGATEGEAIKILPKLSCVDAKKTLLRRSQPMDGPRPREDQRVCMDFLFKIGETGTFNTFFFTDGKLARVNIMFKSESYDYLKSIFIDKYGKPSDVIDSKVRTKRGVEHDNQRLTWTGDNVVLDLNRYYDNINWGCASYITKDEIKKSISEREKGKEKAVKDF